MTTEIANSAQKLSISESMQLFIVSTLLMSPIAIYVDEKNGSDDSGNGSEAAPFQTSHTALEKGGEAAKILVKKEGEDKIQRHFGSCPEESQENS